MLQNISWKEYWLFLFASCAIYYLVVYLRFFRGNLAGFKKQSPVTFVNSETKKQPAMAHSRDNDAEFEQPPLGSEEQIPSLPESRVADSGDGLPRNLPLFVLLGWVVVPECRHPFISFLPFPSLAQRRTWFSPKNDLRNR